MTSPIENPTLELDLTRDNAVRIGRALALLSAIESGVDETMAAGIAVEIIAHNPRYVEFQPLLVAALVRALRATRIATTANPPVNPFSRVWRALFGGN